MIRLAALGALAIASLAPSNALAAVTATTQVSSTGVSLSVRGDSHKDKINVACGDDGNVKVNRLDPASEDYPPTTGVVACADLTSITADGGGGPDTIDLTHVSAARGFTNAKLCGPCPGGSYAIVAECLDGAGRDFIKASPIGTLIGGCSGRQSMTGNDSVYGGKGDDAIAAGPGYDSVNGRGGGDQIFGGPGLDDLIAGKQGNDVLSGSSGDDRLAGGPGRDGLFGGPGRDSCRPGPDGGSTHACEITRGASRVASLGFAPRF